MKPSPIFRCRAPGFTLIELLVVIAITCDLNQWSPPDKWVIAPHCNGGAAQQGGIPFLYPDPPKTSAQVGARGGNELFLDGSVQWRNIRQMTNYAASPWGNAYMNAW